MKFGPVPLYEAEGALLAHSVRLADGTLKKGRQLTSSDLARLEAAGILTVTIARPEPGDLHEDIAAGRVAGALVPKPDGGVSLSAPFTGRANLFAEADGVFEVDPALIAALNTIDEALTIATLPAFSRVSARQMLATVKIIPYGLPEGVIERAEALLAGKQALCVHAFRMTCADLVLTRTPGMPDKVIAKGAEAVRQRLRALGISEVREHVVPHTTNAVAEALTLRTGDLTLILTGSATSDRADVGPAAVVASGGTLTRFGMPVDPGNLLFLGELGGTPVIGLPGCARSPKLNGADWVLERIVAGINVASDDIAAMGVGGLLKEIPARPQPRAGGAGAPKRPRVTAVLLAAGSSSRMGGRDKLLESVGARPLIRVLAERLLASGADEVVCVMRPDMPDRRAALDGLAVRLVENPRAAEGMGTSIAAGIRASPLEADAAIIVLGDMPDVACTDIDRLIAGFDPGEGRAIVRAVDSQGRSGHPVLFGRRFFEALGGLEGDQGARSIIDEHAEFVVDVPLAGAAARTDLDTPEDWAAWRAGISG